MSVLRIAVGFDLREAGDGALVDAVAHADGEPCVLHLVHVVDQRALDATGQLENDQKRAVATERTYPEAWKRAKRVAEAHVEQLPFGLPDDVTVHVRFAQVHATRTNEEIARQILQVAVDFGCGIVVVGRRALPGSVAEHAPVIGKLLVLKETARAVFLAPAEGQIALAKSAGWSG